MEQNETTPNWKFAKYLVVYNGSKLENFNGFTFQFVVNISQFISLITLNLEKSINI